MIGEVRLQVLLGLLFTFLLAVGCAGCKKDQDCKTGATQGCTCVGGESGTQTCGENGAWGECACAVCQSDATQDCTCAGGESGTQACKADGSGWEDCNCEGCGERCGELPDGTCRTECSVDDDCDIGWYCEIGCCHQICFCSTDEDCRTDPCNLGDEAVCTLGSCRPGTCCSSDADCAAGECCKSCACGPCPDCSDVGSIRIMTPPSYAREGESIQFMAQALNANGAVLPGLPLSWASSDEAVATIDATTGLATCGATTGSTEITADCAGSGTSDPVVLTCFAATLDTRVIVIDGATGAPVEAATVVADATEGTTNAQGVVSFAGLAASEVSVFTQGYQYVTAKGLTKSDLVFYLRPLPDPTRAGGIKGDYDFSQLIAKGEIELGLSGMSIPGDLTNLDFTTLLGEMIMTHIKFGELFDDDVPLPSGLHLALGTSVFKEGYMVLGDDGPRVLWGLGGQLPLSDVMELASPIIDRCSNECDIAVVIGETLPRIMPYLYRFQHGVITGVDLTAIPKVADTGDINGDGDETDLVADFDGFPTRGPLVLDTPMRLALELDIPAMPSLGESDADAAIILTGALAPEGLVILGLGAGVDKRDENDEADGKVGVQSDGKVQIKMAPQHGGIEGNPYVIATLAMSMAGLAGDSGGGMPISGRLQIMDSMPADNRLEVPAFLGAVGGATFDAGSRQFAGNQVEAADLYRVSVIDEGAQWQVYLPSGNPSFTLPEVPAGHTDIGATPSVSVEAWQTRNGLDLDGLLEFNSTNMDGLVRQIEGFSVVVLGGEGGGCELDLGCAASGRPSFGAYGWGLLVGLLVVLRRRIFR